MGLRLTGARERLNIIGFTLESLWRGITVSEKGEKEKRVRAERERCSSPFPTLDYETASLK